MNWIKALTRSGRQELFRSAAKSALTPQVAADWTAGALNATLMKTIQGVDEDKLKRIVGYCEDGANLFVAVAHAVEDKVITAEEATDLYTRISRLSNKAITQENVDALIETIAAKIP